MKRQITGSKHESQSLWQKTSQAGNQAYHINTKKQRLPESQYDSPSVTATRQLTKMPKWLTIIMTKTQHKLRKPGSQKAIMTHHLLGKKYSKEHGSKSPAI
jgi:hypothetical protein